MITIHCISCGQPQRVMRPEPERQLVFKKPDKYYRHEIKFVPTGVEINGAFIRLTPMEQIVFNHLYGSIPRLVNHAGMLFHLYGDDEPDCAVNAVHVHVHRINQKLCESAPRWRIENEKGIGRVLRRRV